MAKESAIEIKDEDVIPIQKLNISLPDNIRTALALLKKAGHRAYIVGGCVRDALMGKEPHDWDIATSALPEEIKSVFKSYRLIETGFRHGTVSVVIDRKPVEITTFRIDGPYSDGRHPDSVSFAPDIRYDLSRRDFTINALAYGDEEWLIDPFGGAADIRDRIIRCVGDPVLRFNEDALRILRGLRFASLMGFDIEGPTAGAMVSCSGLLKNVAQERITSEFCALLLGVNVRRVLSDFREILMRIIPEMEPMVGFDQRNPYHVYDVFEHTLISLEHIESDTVLRTTMLLHDIGKPECFFLDEKGRGHFHGHNRVSAQMAERILTRMRFPSAEKRDIVELIRRHDMSVDPTPAGVKKLLNRFGETYVRRLLKVKRADVLAQNPEFGRKKTENITAMETLLEDILAKKECFSLKDLAVNGNDLIAHGIGPGALIGKVLGELLDHVIEGKLDNEREVLIKKALELVDKKIDA